MGWIKAADEAALREAGRLAVELEGNRIGLFLIDEALFAIGNVCTHQFALLTDGYVEDGCVECPLHQGLFDLRTGAAKSAPVTEAVPTFAVKIENGEVLIDLERPSEVSVDDHSEGSPDTAAGAEAGSAPAAEVAPETLRSDPFVIVGAGQAGARAAEAAREAGFDGSIILIGEESTPPYERPPLSKDFLLGRSNRDTIRVLSQERLDALGVELRTQTRVAAINRNDQTVTLAGGERLRFGRLLLATGARVRRLEAPGTDGEGIHYLRTVADAERLREALAPGRRLVVIGGGFIGLEIASSAREIGVETTVLEREETLMSRILPAAVALDVAARAVAAGVTLELGAEVEAFERVDGALQGVRLTDGRAIEADLAVVGVGAIPNSDLAERAGLEVDGGVVVDVYGRTSDPSIFAAGDATRNPRAEETGLPRLESWQNAQEQAIAAARTAVGRETEYSVTPWFWSDQFGSTLQMFGVARPDHRVLTRPAAGDRGGVSFFCFSEDHALRAVISIDDPEGARRGRAVLDGKEPSGPLLEDLAVADRNSEEEEDMDPQYGASAGRYIWPNDETRIPDWVYTDQVIYEREVERIFHGDSWNYVALEAEIPNAGDFVRSNVGPTPVVVTRGEDGEVNVFENRCAHRAAEFCRSARGNAKEFVCPYHQWSYDLEGNLSGVPFRRGVAGKGGMPKDFRPEEHGVRKLNVAQRGGVVFASYADDMPSVEEYMSPVIQRDFDAVFNGRPLKILGYYRNTLPGNWKLYHENLKDPYHATLLHTFLVTFGLLVAGNKSEMIADPSGRHGTMASAKSDGTKVDASTRKEMRAYREGMGLNEPRFMDFIEEFDSPWSVTMQTIWPNLIVQREMNTLGVRQIVPKGPNEFVMNWTMFGYADDDEEMTRHRLRQGNLMGPSGFLGLEDNEAMKFVQDGMLRGRPGRHLVALDPDTPVGTSDTLISEAAIRGMYRHWREAMGL